MELSQIGHHLWMGTYLAYLAQARIGRILFALSPFDKTLAKAHAAWWKDILRHPGRVFDQIHLQSIGIIQAPDIQPDGRADMCDSCPDITYYDGNWSIRAGWTSTACLAVSSRPGKRRRPEPGMSSLRPSLASGLKSLAQILKARPRVPVSLKDNRAFRSDPPAAQRAQLHRPGNPRGCLRGHPGGRTPGAIHGQPAELAFVTFRPDAWRRRSGNPFPSAAAARCS